MIGKLLFTADGKIPFIQIVIGMIVGAVGMLIYAKFCKPRILYEEKFTVPLGPSVEKKPKSFSSSGKKRSQENTLNLNGAQMGAPLIFEMESIQLPRQTMPAPVLPEMTELSEEDEESEEDDDDLSETSSVSKDAVADYKEFTRDEREFTDESDRMRVPPI